MAFVVYGYRAAEGRARSSAGRSSAALLGGGAGGVDDGRQHAVLAAADRDGGREDRRCARAAAPRRGSSGPSFRDLAGVFLVVVALVIAATLASALAWSGVRADRVSVPLVGLRGAFRGSWPRWCAAWSRSIPGLTALGAAPHAVSRLCVTRAAKWSAAHGRISGRGGGVVGVTGRDLNQVRQRRDRRARAAARDCAPSASGDAPRRYP
mgnify:CR=1 FL=1